MLLIRNAQLDALAVPQRQRFVDKALEDLGRLFPDDPRVRDRAAMRPAVEAAIDRAVTFGIDGPREVSLYVYLSHELGPAFEDAPGRRWMKALLHDRAMPAPARLDAIYARLEAAARARAS